MPNYRVNIDGVKHIIDQNDFENNYDAIVRDYPDAEIYMYRDDELGTTPVRRYREALDSGLRVFIKPDDRSPEVTAVGSGRDGNVSVPEQTEPIKGGAYSTIRQPTLREMVHPKASILMPNFPTSEPDVEASRHPFSSYNLDNRLRDAAKRGELDVIIRDEEEKDLNERFKPGPVESISDVSKNYADRFMATQRGNELANELLEIEDEIKERYAKAYLSSPEYKELASRYTGDELVRKVDEDIEARYGDKINADLKPYRDAYNDRLYKRYGDKIREEQHPFVRQSLTGQVEDLRASVEEDIKNFRGGLQDTPGAAFIPGTASAAAGRYGNPLNQETQDAYTSLRAAKGLIEESENIIRESGRKGRTSFVGGAARGFADKAFDVDTWTFGLTDFVDASLLKKAADKFEKGAELTPEEDRLLEAAAVNLGVNAYFSSDLGRGYKAGSVTAEAIPFMLEIALNPVAASGKAIAKSVLKYGMEKYGLKLAGKAAGKALKVGARLVGDGVAAAGITGTTGLGRVATGAVERMTGDIKTGMDDQGGFSFDGTENRQDIGEAVLRSVGTTFFEYESEMMGGVFAPALRSVGKALKDIPGMGRLSASGAGKLYRGIVNNPQMRRFAERTQFHGAIIEYAEEVYNNLMNVAMGEMPMETFTDLDQNIDTFLGVSLMSVALGGVGAAGLARESYMNRRNMKRFESALTDEERDLWSGVKQQMKADDLENTREVIKEILANDALTDEQKKAGVMYVANMLKEGALESVHGERANERIEQDDAEIDRDSNKETGEYVEASIVDPVTKEVTVGTVVGGSMGDGKDYVVWRSKTDGKNHYIKKNEIDQASVRALSTGEVKEINAEMVRENTKAEAERMAKYSPDIPKPDQETVFELDGKPYRIVQGAAPGGLWVETVNSEGKPAVIVMSIDEYYDAMQAEIDARESDSMSKIEAVNEGSSPDGESNVSEGRPDGDVENQPAGNVPESVPASAGEAQRGQVIEEIIGRAPRQKNGEVDYDALLENDPEAFAVLYESEEGVEETRGELSSISENLAKNIQTAEKKLSNATSINQKKEARKTIAALRSRKAAVDAVLQGRYGPKAEEGSEQEVKPVESVTDRVVTADQELDDKGIPFVKASNGTTIFGEVGDEQAMAIGTNVVAPIKLSEGNEDYGKTHIADRYNQLKQNGYNSVEEFVEDVSRNYDEIRIGNLYTDGQGNEKETFLLVKKGKKGNVLYVELNSDENFYNVNSGGIFKNSYINKRGLLWNASTEHSTSSAVTQDFPTTQLNAESGAVSALSQSNPLSVDKDNEVRGEKQGNGVENVLEETGPAEQKDTEIINEGDGSVQPASETVELEGEIERERAGEQIDENAPLIKESGKKLKGLLPGIFGDFQIADVQFSNELWRIKYENGNEIIYIEFTANEINATTDLFGLIKDRASRAGLPTDDMERNFLEGKLPDRMLKSKVNVTSDNPIFTQNGGKINIRPLSKKTKVSDSKTALFSVAEEEDGLREVLKGILHDAENGVDVASNSHVIVSIPANNKKTWIEGRDGKEITEQYPNWRSVIPDNPIKITAGNIQAVTGKVAGALRAGKFTSNQVFVELETDGGKHHFSPESLLLALNALQSTGSASLVFELDNNPSTFGLPKPLIIRDSENANKLALVSQSLLNDRYTVWMPNLIVPIALTSEEKQDNVRYQTEQRDDLEAVNERFNEELDNFNAGTVKPHEVLHLGKPLEILQASGVKDGEMTVTQKTLKDHLNTHGLTTEDLKGLAKAIQNPIMVYEWGTKAKSTIIVTELSTQDGRKITVALRAEHKGNNLSVNEIASVHGKAAERFLSEMENAKEGGLHEALRYVQKEKALNWLGIAPPKGATQAEGLISIAKVIESFENPSIREQKSASTFKPLSAKRFNRLVDRLKQTGLARDVITDREQMREYLEKHLGNPVRFMSTPQGEVYGFVTLDGTVYLDPEKMNANTPVHEFGHLWNTFTRARNPELYVRGAELIKRSPYWQAVNDNPAYSGLSEAAKVDEALAMAIGDKGEAMMQSGDIFGIAEVKNWLREVWDWIKGVLGMAVRVDAMNLTLEGFTEMAVRELTSGSNLSEKHAGNEGVSEGVIEQNVIKAQSETQMARQQDYDFDVTGITEANAREMKAIKERAQADGTFMKAPNGKDTNLNERQWLQVRTGKFKDWFGDWEKSARIEKLRESEPVEITGKEITPSDDLKVYRNNAKSYGKSNLRNVYTNKDSGVKVEVVASSIDEVVSHNLSKEQLQSIAAIPQIIENSIFIDTLPNTDNKRPDIKEFNYYVVGLKIGGVDYTVKAVIANNMNGERYYDHSLTQIEKVKLLDEINQQGVVQGASSGLSSTSEAGKTQQSRPATTAWETTNFPVSKYKDRRLISILQTNSSKVVDEHGEPLVVYHGTGDRFTVFDKSKLGGREDKFFFTPSKEYAEEHGREGLISAFLNIREFNGNSGYFSVDEENDSIPIYDTDKRNGVEIFVDNPSQIKSATDNNGDFDNGQGDIRFQIESEMQNEKPVMGEGESVLDFAQRMADWNLENPGENGIFAETSKTNDNVSESVSQRKLRTQAKEDGRMEEVAARLRERIAASERDAQKNNETLSWQQKRELEQRTSETYAKENGIWIPMNKIFSWHPLLGGNENDVYLNVEDGSVYKVNNLVNSKNILSLFERIKLHNQLFPESAYTFIGFTGFDNSSVYPVLKQEYVRDSTFATPEEIDGYMSALGFKQTGEAEYSNGDITVSDLYPRNVLKDSEGDIYVIDAEFRREEKHLTTDEGKPFADYSSVKENPTTEINRDNGKERTETGLDNPKAMGRRAVSETLAEPERRDGIYKTVEARNLAGSIETVREIEEREELESRGINPDDSDAVRFQIVDEETSDGTIEAYDEALNAKTFDMQLSAQDHFLAVRLLQEIIEKKHGVKLKSFEDAYMVENQSVSRSKAESDRYLKTYLKPLIAEIKALVKQGAGRDDVTHYMMSKHGLERNPVMARREADKWLGDVMTDLDGQLRRKEITPERYAEREASVKSAAEDRYRKNLETDYSGLSGLMKKLTGKATGDFTAFAEGLVEAFEQRFDTSALWERTNAATQRTLRKGFESGLISKAVYDKVSGMYRYYIPLRGWEETTADQMYDYLTPRSDHDATLKKAGGRQSVADDPVAHIASMAGSAIIAGNRNLMKQHFLNMAINHPSDLVTVREVWYENKGTDGHPVWEASFPNIPENATAEEVAQAMDDHDLRMAELAKDGKARKSTSGIDVKYRITPMLVNEHVVTVKRNGRDYMLFINGNPRAAQALNGKLNPEATGLSKLYNRFGRMFKAGMTSYNPDFVMANFVRDALHASYIRYMEGGWAAMLEFQGNIPRATRAVYRGVRGKFDPDSETDVLFREFVMYGGETGYGSDHSLERWKAQLAKEFGGYKGLKRAIDGGKAPLRLLGSLIETSNRVLEDAARFNAYYTSRKRGEDIETSIRAAKNISVNFNRHGARGKAGGFWGHFAGIMNDWIPFWNPMVQGTCQILGVGRRNRRRFSKILAVHFAAGFFMPYINELLVAAFGDDDDDYWNQNAFTRRTNFMLFIPGTGYFKLPLPQFFREVYGLGEILYGFMNGHSSAGESTLDSLNQLRSMFSLEGQEGEWDAFHFLSPYLLDPVADISVNKNFMGVRIANRTDYNRFDPEHSRIFKGVNPAYVTVSKALNEFLGGDDVSRSEYLNGYANPAYIQHLVTTYTGGVGKTISNVTGMVVDAINGDTDNIPAKNIPVVNRFISIPDDRTRDAALNRAYYKLVDRYEKIKNDYEGYERKVEEGYAGYEKRMDEMERRGDTGFMDEMRYYIKDVNSLLKELKDHPDDEQIQEELRELKKEAVSLFSDTEGDGEASRE